MGSVLKTQEMNGNPREERITTLETWLYSIWIGTYMIALLVLIRII
jgi:hypothetical protein